MGWSGCSQMTWLCRWRLYNITPIMAEEQKGRPVAEIMRRLLEENPNDPDIKRQLKDKTVIAEKHTYHALTGSEEQYLQAYGLTYHEEEHFNYINMVLHQRTTHFLDRIADSSIDVRSTIPPPPPPPPVTPKEIVEEVEEVMRNLDLPLSLFKRQDHYWSQDNAKTVQVREYIKELHDRDRQWKSELKKKRQEILNEKNQQYHRTIEEQTKTDQKMKEEEKVRMIRKIEQLKGMVDARKRTIDDGLDFIKKQGRPLYKKMEEDFYNRVELPSLEEKKRKLTEVREMRRSVDLNEIQQHREKYDKIKEEHEGVKIANEPVKVSFKGEFYKSMERSRAENISESRAKSLVDKRTEYAQMIKDNFKPIVDEEKAAEVTERIEQMHKRFTRAKNKFKREDKGEDDDQQDEEQQDEPEPDPQPQEDEEEEEDEDDEFKIEAPKDDQYEPTHDQRYKMGLKYLEIAKAKRKAQQKTEENKQVQRQTFTAQDLPSQQEASSASNPPLMANNNPLPSNESARRIKYRNYLHEMTKTNKTIDFIDTSRIKGDLTQDMRVREKTNLEELHNKIRNVEEKAKHEEELLKYRKVNKNEAIGKKLELDNAIIDTIKARLAMMKT